MGRGRRSLRRSHSPPHTYGEPTRRSSRTTRPSYWNSRQNQTEYTDQTWHTPATRRSFTHATFAMRRRSLHFGYAITAADRDRRRSSAATVGRFDGARIGLPVVRPVTVIGLAGQVLAFITPPWMICQPRRTVRACHAPRTVSRVGTSASAIAALMSRGNTPLLVATTLQSPVSRSDRPAVSRVRAAVS